MKLDLPNRIETPGRSRFSAQTRNTTADTPEESKLGNALLKQMQDVQHDLKSLNTFTYNAKQAATNKAGLLKQRLEMLKAMLLHASPELAKSLARELKSIAHELASLAKSIGGSSPSSVSTTGNTSAAVVSDTTSAEIDAAASDPVSQDLDTGTVARADTGSSEDSARASNKTTDALLENVDRDGDDKTLRAALAKARKLLKEVIEQLKARINRGDKDARRDIEAAEKSLDKLDQSLAGGWQSSFYTASGVSGITASTSTGLLVSAGLSGMRIDVSA